MKQKFAWVGLLLVIAAGAAVFLLLRETPPAPIVPAPAPAAAPAPGPPDTPAPAPKPVEPPRAAEPSAVEPAAPAPPPAGDPDAGGPVRGRVVSVSDSDEEEGSGEPIPNAKLVLWRDHPYAWWESQPTRPLAEFQADEQGRFTIPPIADAETMELTLVVSAPGWGARFEKLYGLSPGIEHEIELHPGFTLQGTVTDTDDRPLAGVRVFLAMSNAEIQSLYRRGNPVPGPFPQTLTGGDGRYRLDDVELDDYPTAGGVDGSGFLGLAWIVELPEEGRLVECDIRIERQGALAVQVCDPSGRPAATRRWDLVRRESDKSVPGESRLSTDADTEVGTLRFANLPTGRWTVLLWPEGWQPEHREVEVRAGVETKLEVICRPGHRLSGTVQDQAGRPVKEAWISVQPAELLLAGHGIGLHGVSDAKGRFSFAGLPEGEVRLEVKLHLHVFLRLTVPAGTEGLVITLWEQPELRGRVRLEPGEPAPAEVKVWILEEFGASVPTVTLEPDGSFRAGVESKPLELGRWSGQSPPPAGREVRVVVQIAGWPPAEARTVRIAPGESTDLGEYSRPPGRVVQGRVLGPDGRPAAGAQVSLEFLRGRVALSAAIREDGSFRVENAPPWEGELRVDGGPDLPFVRRFLPAAGDAPIDVRLGRGGRIRGRVTDVAGRPVEGTTVLLTHVRTPGGDELYVGMGTSMTTGQDGGFLSRAVPPDTYRLQVFAGDEHAGPEVAVREGETTIADIRLPVSIRR